jgi:hypothetical protein
LPLPLLLCAQEQTNANEGRKITYDIQTDFVVSTGNNTPFWLVNNRHGQSSLEDTNANLSVGIYHDFDKKQRFNWGYGIELVGAYNHPKTFYVQQFYTDVKYNCWELSLGSKERWAEGKHHTLSAGGLTFSQNARPIPQVRFGINEYTQVPWWFNGWVQVKGHFSYGWYTDSNYMLKFVQNATNETLYMQDILLHEKTAFLKIGNPQKSSLSFEFGLEMYCQFGGSLYKKTATQELLVYELPHTYKEYIKAFIPLAGGKNTPTAEQTNINGNQLGSWHFITNYNTPNMAFKFYYEHFFEDHSQMIGFAFNRDWKGEIQKISYLPWSDGLWGIEVNLPQFHYITSFVYEYTELKDQSGPILHNSSNSLTEQVSGFDCYYHHYIYQGWQHWGMGLGTPLATSAAYNKNGNPTISSSRIKAHHLGIEGNCSNELSYRLLTTYVRHWGTYRDPLKDIGYQVSTLIEMQYKLPLPHITCKLSLAKDWSNTVIGDNIGASLTIKYTPSL